ncbi:MAG: FecR domain-containing protein, partial [Candidatus Aminicenantes bacterium]|nr:FecR domain-containing protein [Candidatus Aminicenantes bacterium]
MHLSDEKIAQLIEDRINKAERDECLKHISGCAECFEVYTESIKSLEKEKIKRPHKRFFIVTVRKKKVLRFLAAAILIISLPFLWKAIKPYLSVIGPEELTEVLIDKGEKRKLILSDGTQVFLDSGSVFSFPQKFSRENRKVYLNGEAYFKVTHDNTRTFIVHANHAIIEVKGTEFNVRAWNQTQKVKVAVAEGKVTLGLRKAERGAEVLISKGQLSVLPEDGEPSEPMRVDIDKHLSWINRDMVFDNAPMREILNQLERWHNVHFVVDKNISVSSKITVHIQ